MRLKLDEKAKDIVISIDEHRLMQVLTNLLSNAVKFSPLGGEVVLSATRIADEVEISVQDNGPGISEDFKHKIFQRFSQADASSAKMKGGTGLGLALCKEIVEAMHGFIGFESEPGCGARFYISFPLRH